MMQPFMAGGPKPLTLIASKEHEQQRRTLISALFLGHGANAVGAFLTGH